MGIEVASLNMEYLSCKKKERKKKEQKVHHLLKNTGTLGTKPAAVSIEINHSLYGLKIEPFSNLGFYIRG